ncbi:hypothetical protein C4569_03505 [Candidatus Parcubacteria bacterium]|nr:MAG: hypothetical protein C4569_03505 [Candidatus Parcubacteria bacterium]
MKLKKIVLSIVLLLIAGCTNNQNITTNKNSDAEKQGQVVCAFPESVEDFKLSNTERAENTVRYVYQKDLTNNFAFTVKKFQTQEEAQKIYSVTKNELQKINNDPNYPGFGKVQLNDCTVTDIKGFCGKQDYSETFYWVEDKTFRFISKQGAAGKLASWIILFGNCKID